ncbi:unnamed protein product [Meganyctiphanes norvegica]|uniref:Uncharacterized protein n=1 Tax=Meganyctiphanes norvegica TaxID=48144 RepID=A0AAV2QSR2_MEGNR
MDSKLTMLLMFYFSFGPGAAGYNCYRCSSWQSDDYYDDECGKSNYHGSVGYQIGIFAGCAMSVFEDGHVWRGFEDYHSNPVEACRPVDDDGPGILCWCPHEKCNKYLCEECFANSTTTPSPSTQNPPSKGLSCYNCVDCPTVDENTAVVTDENFLTCVTVMTSEEVIIRSGSGDAYDDGECIFDGTVMHCHCTTSLCNNM